MSSEVTSPGVGSTPSAVAAAFVANVTSTIKTLEYDLVHSQPSEPIFLQTKLAQCISGLFVGCALFLTCSQVSSHIYS